MDYFITERSAADYDETLGHVRTALESQGFDVLSETELRAATPEGADDGTLSRYAILVAYSPTLARAALDADPDVGVLLPCTVVVREDREGVVVSAADPAAVLSLAGNPTVEVVGDDARTRIERTVSGAAVVTDPAEA